jgi:hypothetical protein
LRDQGQVILEAFSRALSLLDEAIDRRASVHSSSWKLQLWKAAAEAEYLAFQISLQHGLVDFEPSEGKQLGNGQGPLAAARSLLLQAQASVQEDPRRSYEAVRAAVAILRSAHANEAKAARRRLNRLTKNRVETLL